MARVEIASAILRWIFSHFFVLAEINVFLKFRHIALQFAPLVDDIPLQPGALRLAHNCAVFGKSIFKPFEVFL